MTSPHRESLAHNARRRHNLNATTVEISMQQTQDIIIPLLSLLKITSVEIVRLKEATNIMIDDFFSMPQKGRLFRKSAFHAI